MGEGREGVNHNRSGIYRRHFLILIPVVSQRGQAFVLAADFPGDQFAARQLADEGSGQLVAELDAAR